MHTRSDNIKQKIKEWWAENPQTYAYVHGKALYKNRDGSFKEVKPGSLDFFRKVDEAFYEYNRPLHTKDDPFGKIFLYDKFRHKNVLEIGCGMGTMAMLWAMNGAKITAIDLNPFSLEQTKARFSLMGVQGSISQADAHDLPFASESFDYVYSWGVLHHSPNLERSLQEMFRVLRRGGTFGVMLYNRGSLLYRYRIKYLEGYIHMENRFLNEVQMASRYADGSEKEGNPYTWPETKEKVTQLFAPYCSDLEKRLFGTELDYYLKLLLVGFSILVPRFTRKSWARRYGWCMWVCGEKKAL